MADGGPVNSSITPPSTSTTILERSTIIPASPGTRYMTAKNHKQFSLPHQKQHVHVVHLFVSPFRGRPLRVESLTEHLSPCLSLPPPSLACADWKGGNEQTPSANRCCGAPYTLLLLLYVQTAVSVCEYDLKSILRQKCTAAVHTRAHSCSFCLPAHTNTKG